MMHLTQSDKRRANKTLGKQTCKIPDKSCEALINAELRGRGQTEYLMVDFRCECQMSMCYPAILKRSAAGQPLEIRRENQCRNHEANSVRHLRVLARSQSLSGILHACLPRAKSITLAQTGWKYEGGNRVWLFGRCYRFHQSREIVGIIKTLTTKRSPTGRMEVMFSCLCEEEPVVRSKTGHTAAFDFGLTQFLTGHNGHDIPAPLPLRHSLRQVRKANRALSRTLPGSAIGNKPDTRWQRCTGALPTSGRPGIGTLPMRCVSSMTTIYLEDLELRGMAALWGRKVSDLGFGRFVQILHQTATKLGTHIHHIDRFFPSTKLCHVCGTLNAFITLRDRVWTCACGTIHQRDRNAARNIYREGASSHAQGRCKTTSVAATA